LLNLFDLFSETEQEEYKSMESPESKRLYAQQFFKKDFGAFVYLLGYRDTGMFHVEQMKKIAKSRIISDNPIRRLWLWSRGFFKTSLITEAHTLWLIVNNPNIRILIVSFTIEVAKKPLGAIRNHITSNEDFRYFFKEFCPIPNKDGKIEFGTTENLTVPNRTKQLKEPTVMCAGVGTNITGLHFDYMKIDDLVNKDSVSNDTQIQASKDYYSLLRPIFDKLVVPREDVIGTIYHFNDLHSTIKKNAEFEQSFIPVYDELGNFIFPERISKEGFEALCRDASMNPYDIQSQYLLNPIDPAQRKFKDEWVKYYDSLPEGLSEYMICDPASAVKKKSDFTVIMRWGVDKDMNFYLLDGVRDRLLSNDRVAMYVAMSKQAKRLKGAIYEVIGGRHGDLENIKDKFIAEKLHIEPRETKSTSASKQDRIEQRLTGQFHAGKILFPKKMPKVYRFDGKSYDFVEEYLLEYRQFPFSEHDDILDCHSQLFDGEFIQKGADKPEPKKEDNEFDWFRNMSIHAKASRKLHYSFGNKEKYWSLPATKSYR
jgi:phage terminase large subunit-like protein